MAALLINTSSPPNSVFIALNVSWTAFGSPISQGKVDISPVISRLTCNNFFASRPIMATRAPSEHKALAIALPKPWLPPVMAIILERILIDHPWGRAEWSEALPSSSLRDTAIRVREQVFS